MAHLSKRINIVSGVAIAVGMIVGSGFFGLPGIIVAQSGPVTGFLGWLAVTILVAPLVHIFCTLGLRYPTAEGIAKYAEIAMGPWANHAFSLVAVGSLAVGMPAFFFVGGAYLAELLGLDPSAHRALLAAVLAVITTLFNLWGPEKFSQLGKIVVPAVVVFIIGIIATHLPGRGDAVARLASEIATTRIDVSALWVAAAMAFWAYQGWENMSFGLEEFDRPERTIPLVYWSTFALISVMYLLFSWTISAVYYDGIVVNGISGIAALIGGGPAIRFALLLLIVGVLVVNANSWVFGASRIAYASARRGLLPAALSRLDGRQLPRNSLMACLAVYIMIILAIDALAIDVHHAFLLTTQGFIVLYGTAILAYLKVSASAWRWPLGFTALASWLFLMSGFSWLIIYPLALIVIGWALFRRRLHQPALAA